MSEEIASTLLHILILGGIAAVVWLYAKALKRVKAGALIVYRDWMDFGKSALWLVAFPLGVGWLFSDEAGYKGLGAILLIVGCVSFFQLCAGAFRYNRGAMRGLSLYARFAVVLLAHLRSAS